MFASFPDEPGQQADHLFTQAMEWLRAGRLQSARTLLEQAAALNAEQGRPIPEGYARLALGRVLLELEEPATAEAELTRAVKLLAAAGDRTGQVRLLFELGELAERRGQPQKARRSYEAILELEGEDADTALAHLRLGALHRDAGQGEEAARHYAKAGRLFAATGNGLGEARATLEEARLISSVDSNRSRDLFERGLSLALDYEQDALAAVAHLALGRLAPDRSAARTHLEQARSLAEAAGDRKTAQEAEDALDALVA